MKCAGIRNRNACGIHAGAWLDVGTASKRCPSTITTRQQPISLEVVPYAYCADQGTSSQEAAPGVAGSGYRAAAVGGLVWRCHPESRLLGIRGVGRTRRGAGAPRLVAV